MLDKHSLRHVLAQQRQALPKEEWADRSRHITQNAVADPFFMRATTVALYRPLGNEVDTQAIHEAAIRAHKRVCYPDASMGFVQANGQWEKSPLGFEMPAGGRSVANREIDLFILPGLAFDRSGRRIGRGKGHYDRALAGLRGLRMALAFDFQIFDALPEDAWDLRMHAIATEREVIRLG